MKKLHGEKLLAGLYTIGNEYEELRGVYYVQSTGFRYIALPLENLFETMKMRDYAPIQAFFTDNCCNERNFLEKHLPDLKENLQNTPILPMELSDIEVIDNHNSDILLSATFFPDGDEPSEEQIVGFDIEWPVDYQKRKQPKASSQISDQEKATATKTALVQIAVLGML